MTTFSLKHSKEVQELIDKLMKETHMNFSEAEIQALAILEEKYKRIMW